MSQGDYEEEGEVKDPRSVWRWTLDDKVDGEASESVRNDFSSSGQVALEPSLDGYEVIKVFLRDKVSTLDGARHAFRRAAKEEPAKQPRSGSVHNFLQADDFEKRTSAICFCWKS